MKTKLAIIISGWIALLLPLNLALAQAPNSIGGDGMLLRVTDGTYPFVNYGYGLFIPANSGNLYQAVGIYNTSDVATGTYTYSYTLTGSSTAILNVNVPAGGLIGTWNVYFDTSDTGSYYATATAYPGAYYTADFDLFSKNALGSIVGKTIILNVWDGLYPFASSGSFTFYTAATGNTYRVVSNNGAGAASGTYSYSLVNRSIGKLQLNDSISGVSTLYVGFKNSSGGDYAIAQPSSGGFQIGSFTVLDTTPPTATITSPTAGQRWSNSVFTVTGKTSDDVQVAQVYYHVFGEDWNSATTANGWVTWYGNVTLSTPGTNIIQAYSVDSSGNMSSIASSRIVYVLMAPMMVQINGVGTVSPNYNGQLLEIGKSYSMTATAGAGFAFVNWTGSVSTNRATVSFTMQSDTTLTANFVDVAKPTLVISNLSAGQRWSNEVFNVKGTARDNVQVSQVWYQLNAGDWTNAMTGNQWINWSADLNLVPGTNSFSSYATDVAGNVSSTNTVKLVYVLVAPLTVQIAGKGTLSPNYSNAVLEIGKNYSMTATPGSGFVFTNWAISTNWIDGLVTNKTTVQFTMASNLTLQATFVDIAKPVLNITNLAAGQRVSNAVFTVKGTISDNAQVANVWLQLNGGDWTNAVSGNQWANWSADLNLIPGTNKLSVYAVDTTGNASTNSNRSFQLVVTNVLRVQTVGRGTLSPNYSNAWLEVGRNYSMTATPGTGFVFTNWTVSTNWIDGMMTNKATVQFTMASNLTLQATFADVKSPTIAITNLASGQRVSNAVFTVKGTASDNTQVANVWLQLNGGDWTNAVSGNQWANWSAELNLIPGTNTLSVYAVDATGNGSTNISRKFQFVATSVLSVQTVGRGTLSPNYSNAWLEIGRNYSMTATPGTGFIFTNWIVSTNWIDGVMTNKATVQFAMASNLTLQATFADVKKPALAITNLASGQRVSNAVFTVKGTASDNAQVTNVWLQLNGGDWTNAVTDNQWANWSAELDLIPGTNTLSVYAVDATGNTSTNISRKFQFVVTNVLSVQIVGRGTLSPNYSNAWLEIGRNYSMMATPGSGFAFTNWTISTNWIDGVITNKASVQFAMASNLTLQATFADVAKPTLAITNLAAGQRVSNAVFTVKGTASDNGQLANVWLQLNGGDWTNAVTGNQWANWNADLNLVPGTNKLSVYAMDATGNNSLTNSRSFQLIVANVLGMQAIGLEMISPDYSITTTVPNVFAFTDWSFSADGFSFTLQSSSSLNGRIQVSTNLTSWDTLTNFTGTKSTLNFRDSAATNSSRRFYRAVIP